MFCCVSDQIYSMRLLVRSFLIIIRLLCEYVAAVAHGFDCFVFVGGRRIEKSILRVLPRQRLHHINNIPI